VILGKRMKRRRESVGASALLLAQPLGLLLLRVDAPPDIRIVSRFAAFLGRSPDSATAEDIRRFQIEQRETGMPAPAMNSERTLKQRAGSV
jgi:hypothetical protein